MPMLPPNPIYFKMNFQLLLPTSCLLVLIMITITIILCFTTFLLPNWKASNPPNRSGKANNLTLKQSTPSSIAATLCSPLSSLPPLSSSHLRSFQKLSKLTSDVGSSVLRPSIHHDSSHQLRTTSRHNSATKGAPVDSTVHIRD